MTEEAVGPAPSGTGCAECVDLGGWWLHLRRCVECGHIGCCDSSPAQHASAHARTEGHPIMTSFEPGEEWFWDYRAEAITRPVPVAPPRWRPEDQPSPGPAGSVPDDWRERLHR